MNRRRFLVSSSCVAAQIPLGFTIAFLVPGPVVAEWPVDAFSTNNLNDALTALTGNAAVEVSGNIEIRSSTIAEDGSSVPVEIQSHLPNTKTIIVLSEKNLNPVVARFRISPRLEPYVSTRIKMGGTGNIIALVETDQGFFSAKKQVQVTAGGCG